MRKTIAALLALAGIGGELPAHATRELNAVHRFRTRQKLQPKTRGTMRRSSALIDLELGHIQRGTRAVSRGPYPQHMIDNCAAMRARSEPVRERARLRELSK